MKNRKTHKLYIKNMVCDRCIMTVKNILDELKIPYHQVELGIVNLPQPLHPDKKPILQQRLYDVGFELLENPVDRLVELIKTAVIDYIHYKNLSREKIKLSHFLTQRLHKDYSFLSKIFSEKEKISIEQYLILQKIEKVKELLFYGEKNISEIADLLGYSSPAHLSAQFKKITGLSPTEFKNEIKRNPLDKI